MFNSGYTKRAKRRVNVLRGFDGANPTSMTKNAPVKSGVTVVSGNLLALVSGEWVLYDADTHSSTPYIALSDGADTDVSASGLLPALSCAGKFEIETALYDTDGTYNEDTPIVASATAGIITSGALSGSANIIGFATRGGETNLNAGTGPKVEVNAADGNIVTFVTNWQPFVASA